MGVAGGKVSEERGKRVMDKKEGFDVMSTRSHMKPVKN